MALWEIAAGIMTVVITSGTVTAIVTLWANRRNRKADAVKVEAEAAKIRAEAEEIATQAAEKVIKLLQERIAETEQRNAALEKSQQDASKEISRLNGMVLALQESNTALRHGVRVLIGQLQTAGIEPQWRPADLTPPPQHSPKNHGAGGWK